MENPFIQSQAFAAYYRTLGVASLADDSINESPSNDPTDDEEAPSTRVITRGPDGSVVVISPVPSRQSRGSSFSKAIKKAIEGLRNLFRTRSRSHASAGECAQGVHEASEARSPPIADSALNEQLQRWTWPPWDQPPRFEYLDTDLDPLDTTYANSLEQEDTSFLEHGLDYAYVERPQRMIPV